MPSFYSDDHWGVRFALCENNFWQGVVCLNRKTDFHNLTVVQLIQAEKSDTSI